MVPTPQSRRPRASSSCSIPCQPMVHNTEGWSRMDGKWRSAPPAWPVRHARGMRGHPSGNHVIASASCSVRVIAWRCSPRSHGDERVPRCEEFTCSLRRAVARMSIRYDGHALTSYALAIVATEGQQELLIGFVKLSVCRHLLAKQIREFRIPKEQFPSVICIGQD